MVNGGWWMVGICWNLEGGSALVQLWSNNRRRNFGSCGEPSLFEL